MRRTKIVATLGPATSTPERIAGLIRAGMNVARLNFSHGTHAEHAARIAMVRRAAAEAGRHVAILQDLQGPKIRTGPLENGQPVELVAGQRFVITTEPIVGDAHRVSTTYRALPLDVRPRDRILLSDGLIELVVTGHTDTEVETEVVHGGRLREHQGINLPGVRVSAPAATEKDLADLAFGLEQGVDYVALSFVRRASDVREVKEFIRRAGKQTPVIAKIERPEALDVLPEILAEADGIMVARGDLGVEMPPERVPIVQKQIIAAANQALLPVITATQMLESMIHNPRPTRAEASDVANAIIDGTDAVMLSGETAAGAYPIEAVQMMALIADAVEASYTGGQHSTTPRWSIAPAQSTPRAIAAAACTIANSLPVRFIVVLTQSGASARLVSHYRPEVPILAFCPSEETARRTSLYWGVTPIVIEARDRLDELEQQIVRMMRETGMVRKGDLIVLSGGHPVYRYGPTNFLKVITIE
ncbi:MAG TPA: pyruvate kinase [Chloroflexus aurantiacus]|jgi:pyruvate kinase|uniref:Pyruvate kinase n=1 Tax=Chloroflexus aurantiacus (strain ATCC 29366 / DSM 635 / J-10-fl) TaxID=324602 RepID=A9WHK0_CHLAA|nr:pyruvate kinase [Chloroflexus aurantiacus]ABY36326.1 pyruvate kinase [Chloroflexus aurantiacus J-10-fl]HBW66617.1 pyruvate kinase [Chloroflexus aurantiacus]